MEDEFDFDWDELTHKQREDSWLDEKIDSVKGSGSGMLKDDQELKNAMSIL